MTSVSLFAAFILVLQELKNLTDQFYQTTRQLQQELNAVSEEKTKLDTTTAQLSQSSLSLSS